MTQNEHTDTTDEQLTVDDVRNADFGFDELTEEEIENATDAVQVRNLVEVDYSEAFKRDDVEKVFEIKTGVKFTGFDMNDTRRRVALYKIPDGFMYFVGDEVYTHYEYDRDRPQYQIIVDDAIGFVEHAVYEKNHDVEEAFEFTHVDESEETLKNKVENGIFEQFEDN